MSKIFFTSDEHYGHFNILQYDARPFTDLREMEETMVERHNSIVGEDDVTYHLGDFSWRPDQMKFILDKLNGRHILITGNHDRCSHVKPKGKEKWTRYYIESGFSEITSYIITDFPGLGRCMMSHFPLLTVESEKFKDRYVNFRVKDLMGCKWLIHGHVHKMWVQRRHEINVGCQVRGYSPILLEQLVASVDFSVDSK